jgi:hypothetical protein
MQELLMPKSLVVERGHQAFHKLSAHLEHRLTRYIFWGLCAMKRGPQG